jgi:Domain of unknown function (DUF4394)
MRQFWSRRTGRRRSAFALGVAFLGLVTLVQPAAAWATDSGCGRVYLATTQNELLRLHTSAEIFEIAAEFFGGRGAPAIVRERKFIAGLADGETLIGIDFRPATGILYGVGRIGAAGNGQLYTIDVRTGRATAVGGRTIPLAGVAFGVDFNPVPDLIRIVSDTGLNMRIRPADGTVAGTDTSLAYPAMGDPNAGRMPRVVAVAYTNPDTDPQTNTVLHDLDVNRAADADRDGDVLDIQVPPNGGVLNTVGNLGVDADDLTAFDIGPDNEALAAIRPVGSPFSRLYFVDLPSGRAVDLGRIGKGELVVGLAIQLGPQCSTAR